MNIDSTERKQWEISVYDAKGFEVYNYRLACRWIELQRHLCEAYPYSLSYPNVSVDFAEVIRG